MLWLVLAFVPWILWWLLGMFGQSVAGGIAGLVAAAVLAWLHRRTPRMFGLTTLAFFAVYVVAAATLGVDPFANSGIGTAIIGFMLAFMAVSMLLTGTPFSLEYVRHDWPELFWEN